MCIIYLFDLFIYFGVPNYIWNKKKSFPCEWDGEHQSLLNMYQGIWGLETWLGSKKCFPVSSNHTF